MMQELKNLAFILIFFLPMGAAKIDAADGAVGSSPMGQPRQLGRDRRIALAVLGITRKGNYFFLRFLGGGTLPPARRASESPIAIACFLLLTFLPDRPLFSVPLLRSCSARRTF